jgi:hypothetical protein
MSSPRPSRKRKAHECPSMREMAPSPTPAALAGCGEPPRAVWRDMGTVDPLWRPRWDPEPRPEEMVRQAQPTALEICRAAQESLSSAADCRRRASMSSRLALMLSRNVVTGSYGVTVHRRTGPYSYSRPLAELLKPAAELKDRTAALDALGWAASSSRLALVPAVGRGARAVFAVMKDEKKGDMAACTFLARLLATPFEISQWAMVPPLPPHLEREEEVESEGPID